MRFGIFYEHQLPRPWTDTSELELFQNALEQIELADHLGFDYAWATEHHFLEEYSHSSAPEVFLAAASQRTKRIRLGHGIIQLTTNQPQRVAERVSTLDLVSNGRVELGMGEGAGPAELHPFNIRVRDKRQRWEEAVRAIIPLFSDSAYAFQGEYYSFEARNVVPKPLQQPHPPLWVGCSNIQTIEDAGGWGMGALGFNFVSPEAAQAWVHRYYNTYLHRPKRLGSYQPNPNIAVVNGFMCAETDEEALAKASGWTFFQFALGYYGRRGVDAPGASDLWREYQVWRKTDKARQALSAGLVGSPQAIRKSLRVLADAHVDQVILLNQAGKTKHEDIMKSLRLFAHEVMPEFHALEEQHQTWKRGVLDGKIQLEVLNADKYDLYEHQTPEMVRLSSTDLQLRMAAKEAAASGNDLP
jgi:alkanesulfonate monooxygenase SsuD/methylene tetrahydromethanopterin reductase-like flavin-dependent oxidoreductase (luciferase family)